MSSLEVVDGKELTLKKILEDQERGIPAQRSAHVGSLNPHTIGIASLGIRTLMHEHIDADDGGYPTNKILVGGSYITISDATKIDTLYAPYRKGDFRVDIHPSGIALIKERIHQAFLPYSIAKSVTAMPSFLTAIAEQFGTISFLSKPEEVLSPEINTLLRKTQTPAQLHYLVCKETPQLGQNVIAASEAVLNNAEVAFDVLNGFQKRYPAAFAEYVTKTGKRLKFQESTRSKVIYSDDSDYIQIRRSDLAKSCIDFLDWQKNALTNLDFNPLKQPQEGPVLSGLAYITITSIMDLLREDGWRSQGIAKIRHIGGNEMHRYMLTDPESSQRRAELNSLYKIAHKYTRDILPSLITVELIPGRELNPFVYSGVTKSILNFCLDQFHEWQGLNISISDHKKNIKPRVLEKLKVNSTETLTGEHLPRIIEEIAQINPDIHSKLIKRIEEGKLNPKEAFERVTKEIASFETAGADKQMHAIDQSIAETLNPHPLARVILGKVNGYTVSQYDALENGVGVVDQALNIPFNEMSGAINWLRSRTSV